MVLFGMLDGERKTLKKIVKTITIETEPPQHPGVPVHGSALGEHDARTNASECPITCCTVGLLRVRHLSNQNIRLNKILL